MMNHHLNIAPVKHTFPVGCESFPMLYGANLLTYAVSEVATITQAPLPMVYSAALSALSVAAQGLVNIKSPTGQVGPVSLSLLTIVESGGGKSTVSKFFTRGIKVFEKAKREAYQDYLRKYKLKLELHKDEEIQIRASMELGNKSQCNQVLDKLTAHEKSKPIKPKLPMLLCEDITIEALLAILSEHTPNAFLFTSEGGVIFKGKGLSNTPVMNSLWSGDDILVSRKVVHSSQVEGARLTMHIMAQKSALIGFMDRATDDIVGNGFTARLLVCNPTSNYGSRFVSGVEHTTDNVDAFNDMVVELATKSAELEDYTAKKTLCFSGNAKVIWLDICNDIEMKMGSAGIYQGVKGHASKLAENISRVAALLHCSEHSIEDEISTATLLSAVNLVGYYSGQYMKVFSAPPKYVADAQALMQWLSAYANSGVRYLKKNKILQNGPVGLRKKTPLDAAMNHLKSWHPLGEITSKNTRVIDLWPQQPFDEFKLKQDLLIDIVF